MNRHYQSPLGDLGVGRLRWVTLLRVLLPGSLVMLSNSTAIAQAKAPLSPLPSPLPVSPEAMLEATLGATPTTQSSPSIPIIAPQPASAALPSEVPQSVFVDAQTGHDRQGDGSQVAPYRTLTHALQVASAGTVILLAPGVYDQAHGEVFPLRLQPGVTVQGQPVRTASSQEPLPEPAVVIQGGGALAIGQETLNVAIIGADRAALVGVTVTNPNPQGYGLWIGNTSPTIVENTFTGNAGAGITIAGQGRPLIQRNQFQDNGMGIHVADTAQPWLRGNRLQHNQVGVLATNQARPQLFHNQFRQNRDGLVAIEAAQPVVRQSLFVEHSRDGVVVLDQALPDLGTEKAAGNNQFQDNGRFDINAHAITAFVPAVGNSLKRDRSLGRIDHGGRITRPIPILAGQEARLSAGGAATPRVPNPSLDTAASPALIPSTHTAIAFPQPLLLAAAAPVPTTAPLTMAAHFPSPNWDTPPAAYRLSTRYATPVIAASSSPRPSPAPTFLSTALPAPQPGALAAAPTVVPTGGALSPSRPRTSAPVSSRSLAQATPSPTGVGPNPVLAVPSGEIPVGVAEGNPSVWQPGPKPFAPRPQAGLRGGIVPQSVPIPTTPVPSSQMPQNVPTAAPQAAPGSTGLPYRVVVQITHPQAQIRLQSLLPNALQVPGRPLMQVATFSDLQPAAQLQKVLKRQGFQVSVAQW
ncbi:DUF1565 domain-containing protein [Trichothermofontia sp.]